MGRSQRAEGLPVRRDDPHEERPDGTAGGKQGGERVDVVRLRARDPAEWARVVRLATPNIRGVICSFSTNDADIDDLQQQCWVRIVDQIEKFSSSGSDGTASLSSFKGWAVVLSRNFCKDLYRAKKRSREPDTVSMDGLGELLDGGSDPDELFWRRRLQQAVWEALGTLPEREREAIVLKHGEGRSTAEIATALHVSPAAVRRLVHRAAYKLYKKEELREWLTR